MGNKMRLCVCTASRSERGLIEPLINKLKSSPCFETEILELPISFMGAFETASEVIRRHEKKLLAICPFDRLEMLGACLAFFLNNVKVAQYHAGDVSGGGETFDDFVRFMITLCSDVQFCNGANSFWRCFRFLKLVGKSTSCCYEVGSLAFDDIQLDDSAVPEDDFDLVLYNPLPRRPELIESELEEIENLLENRLTLWIYPNEDAHREVVIDRIRHLEGEGKVKGFETLPRPQFLALMKHASRVIGNSSSFFLELPYFNKRHVHIGVRNRSREAVEVRGGASERIVTILERVFCGT